MPVSRQKAYWLILSILFLFLVLILLLILNKGRDRIKALIKRALKSLKKGRIKRAKRLYRKIHAIYLKLPDEKKRKYYGQIQELHKRLVR